MSRIVILTAAGLGTRMQQNTPKQFMLVNNKPIIVYTMEAFQSFDDIDSICIVCLKEWKHKISDYIKKYNIKKAKYIIDGGKTGQESIFNALNYLKLHVRDNDTIIIHDGNRPLVDHYIIKDSLEVYARYGIAVAAVPCVEVAFMSEDGIKTNNILNRDKLWRTQTPHTGSFGDIYYLYKKASQDNLNNMAALCSILDYYNKDIYLSKGSEKNLKITTMDDLEIFKALLQINK